MKVPSRTKIPYEECKRRVTADFEWAMGITELLQNDPTEAQLQLIADARRALIPYIEENAQQLFQWINR